MLDKEICKRCVYRAAGCKVARWDKCDDQWWSRGYIVCPLGLGMARKAKAIDRCPYSLEHLMSENKTDA